MEQSKPLCQGIPRSCEFLLQLVELAPRLRYATFHFNSVWVAEAKLSAEIFCRIPGWEYVDCHVKNAYTVGYSASCAVSGLAIIVKYLRFACVELQSNLACFRAEVCYHVADVSEGAGREEDVVSKPQVGESVGG